VSGGGVFMRVECLAGGLDVCVEGGLIPEDHLDPQSRLPQATLLATADEETVQYTAIAQS